MQYASPGQYENSFVFQPGEPYNQRRDLLEAARQSRVFRVSCGGTDGTSPAFARPDKRERAALCAIRKHGRNLERRRSMPRKLLMCLWILLIAGTAAQSAAAEKSTPTVEKISPEQIKEDIRQALEETTVMEFVDTSISDVVEYLKDMHKVKHPHFEMVLEVKTLNDLGITPETTITKSLKGITLRAALRLLLRDLGLTYVIRDDVLLITTPENACYMKVYDVADLVAVKEGEQNAALDSLMGMVAKICPCPPPGQSSWPGWIGSLRSAGVAAIVVNQPEEFHDQIADLLAQLRAVRHQK
jgi:hypothetical protein